MNRTRITAIFLIIFQLLLLLIPCRAIAETTPEYITSEKPFTMIPGASVRLGDEKGIRFAAEIEKSYYHELISGIGVVNVCRGVLIVPVSYLTKTQGVFTREALDACGLDYLDVVSSGWYRENNSQYGISGGVKNIHTENYLLEYTGIAYVVISYDDGSSDTIYANYRGEDNVRSPYTVALAAFACGESTAADYLEGVVDIRKKDDSSYFVRSYESVLSDIDGIDNLVIENPFACRSDGYNNIMLISQNSEIPEKIYIDGRLMVCRETTGYEPVESDELSVTVTDNGILLSLEYDSLFADLEETGYNIFSGNSGVLVSDVTLSKTAVFSEGGKTIGRVVHGSFVGCCTDGENVYYILNSDQNNSSVLVKAKLSGQEVIYTHLDVVALGGIAYNVVTHELMLVYKGDSNGKSNYLMTLDADSLETVSTRKVYCDYSKYCFYDVTRNTYGFIQTGTLRIILCGENLMPYNALYISRETLLSSRGLKADNDYITAIATCWNSNFGGYYGFIAVGKYGGSCTALLELGSDLSAELMDMFFINGRLFAAYYSFPNGICIYEIEITTNK